MLRAHRWTRFAALVGIGCAASACDPGWRVSGTIALAPGVDPTPYARLVIRVESLAEGAEYVDSDILEVVGGVPQRGTPPVPFPIEFAFQHLGTFPDPRLHVSAFLSQSATPTAPASGDPAGAEDVALPRCGAYFGGYCGFVENVALVLEPTP